jgi:hypothetical protein
MRESHKRPRQSETTTRLQQEFSGVGAIRFTETMEHRRRVQIMSGLPQQVPFGMSVEETVHTSVERWMNTPYQQAQQQTVPFIGPPLPPQWSPQQSNRQQQAQQLPQQLPLSPQQQAQQLPLQLPLSPQQQAQQLPLQQPPPQQQGDVSVSQYDASWVSKCKQSPYMHGLFCVAEDDTVIRVFNKLFCTAMMHAEHGTDHVVAREQLRHAMMLGSKTIALADDLKKKEKEIGASKATVNKRTATTAKLYEKAATNDEKNAKTAGRTQSLLESAKQQFDLFEQMNQQLDMISKNPDYKLSVGGGGAAGKRRNQGEGGAGS